ncbi:conserved Plasmodium protein, unknown function [Plasmodium vivax]|uniref:Merozoite surface protein 3 n=1 Tax=Plasmodium vivax (strain Brazil I) TaxID=1033975 RepID=A0A0J9VLJ1_PLAV1|nr:hypothetical protein PVBG_05089 [Plasmodium vivax Brazil I]CAI7719311.1 conserved Plasmodium protein, unknown function [Plasmodium vivax]
MGKFSGLSIFYFVFLLNFCLYKNGVQGDDMANETNPRVRSGPSNNDHSEQMTKKLNRRNGTHQNVRTNARHYHGAVVDSNGGPNLGSTPVTGSAERVASSTGGGTSAATTSGTSKTIGGALGWLFFDTLIKPALDLTIRVVDNRPRDVISGKVKEQTLPQDQPQETQEQAAPPQTPRESPPRQEEPTTLIDNKMLKLERDQQAQTSMNDLREEVQDEVFDDGEDNHVAEDTDEGPNNNTEEDEDEEIVYRYGSDEEAKEIGEEQGFSSLLNDETIHMTHIKEHTDVDEEKEKVEDLVKYMTNSLQENDQLVNTLSGLSDDITMFLRK